MRFCIADLHKVYQEKITSNKAFEVIRSDNHTNGNYKKLLYDSITNKYTIVSKKNNVDASQQTKNAVSAVNYYNSIQV